MPSSSGSIRNWILGGITLVSVSVLFYFLYLRPSTSNVKQIKDAAVKSQNKESSESKKSSKSVTVEDVEGEDDEEEESSSDEEEEEEEEADDTKQETVQLEVKKEPKQSTPDAATGSNATSTTEANDPSTTTDTPKAKGSDLPEKDEATLLKEQYDAALRLGQKLIQGQLNERAAEKLTEAIGLAAKVPSAQKDILTLYNNRSAMYEKLSQFDNSIKDINIVLAMDPFHVKARVRRARVYEAQGKTLLALKDFVYATIVERSRGSESNYDKKITELSKRVAIERTPKTLKDLRSSQKKKALPSKGYCRNFLEAYPNSYNWKKTFYGIDREELANKYNQSNKKSLAAGLDMVKFDLSHENYKKAFETLHELSSALEQDSSNTSNSTSNKGLVSLYHELRGTELHLMFQMDEALKEYELAVSLSPANISAQLKYNSVLLENGERDRALAAYTDLLSILQKHDNPNELDYDKVSEKSSEDGSFADARTSPVNNLDEETKETKIAYEAWVLNHRASLYVSRDEQGFFAPEALSLAMKDLEESLKKSGDVMHLPEGKGAHFIALLKSVQLRTHTKQSMELVTTEEDYAHNRMAIQAAKSLFPEHESVLLLEVEQLALEGDSETATKLVDKASRSGNYDEFIIVNLRATITTNQAFIALQGNAANASTMSYAQSLFEEVNRLYQRALELDPESLEVKAQFAQLKSMMFGDSDGAVTLLKDALSIARSRDEVQDLLTMLVGNEAQAAAVDEIRKSQQ